MIVSVFAYDVEDREPFERVYGPDGEWARFFRGAEGYLGTELLVGDGYLVIDRWSSEAAYDAFLTANAEEYARRNVEASRLYRAERVIGRFAPAP
jgi:heme-degrading monooxygenase HmoA